MKKLIFLFSLFISSYTLAQCDSVSALNAQIVDLAGKKLGKKVDRGECWDLAKYVLDETGANWDGLYKFGRPLKKGECIMPGDIIQFEKLKTVAQSNGVKTSEMFPHHTAIIYEVKSADEIVLIHQNTGYTGKKVGTSTFKFSTIATGKYIIYRPILN
jgi:hypothetical protein